MRTVDIQVLSRRYRDLLTVQNIGLTIALLIAIVWVWGSIVTLQKNYRYQRLVDENSQTIELKELQNKTYQYQQAYFKSDEFIELSARSKLGLALPGEHLVSLPSSEGVKDQKVKQARLVTVGPESNFAKWMHFLFESR